MTLIPAQTAAAEKLAVAEKHMSCLTQGHKLDAKRNAQQAQRPAMPSASGAAQNEDRI